jgi:RsiW-degrading membrane proteinase PrsW (M82 family)
VNTLGYLRVMFAVDDLDETLEAQHRLLIGNSAAKPRGPWSGAVVLAILTVTTVIIPILYLTPSAQRGPLSAPMITGIFFAGIVALLAYVGFEVVRITRAKPEETLQS